MNFNFQELVKEVDAHEQLDEDVEELLLHIADDFIEQTVSQVRIFIIKNGNSHWSLCIKQYLMAKVIVTADSDS